MAAGCSLMAARTRTASWSSLTGASRLGTGGSTRSCYRTPTRITSPDSRCFSSAIGWAEHSSLECSARGRATRRGPPSSPDDRRHRRCSPPAIASRWTTSRSRSCGLSPAPCLERRPIPGPASTTCRSSSSARWPGGASCSWATSSRRSIRSWRRALPGSTCSRSRTTAAGPPRPTPFWTPCTRPLRSHRPERATRTAIRRRPRCHALKHGARACSGLTVMAA